MLGDKTAVLVARERRCRFTAAMVAAAVIAAATLGSTPDDKKRPAQAPPDKPIPPEKIRLLPTDWRPSPIIVFRAEVTEGKHCRQIGDSTACGMVRELEICEELQGRTKMKRLIDPRVSQALQKENVYTFKWSPSTAAREDLAKAAKGGYSGLWVSSETFTVVPEPADWRPSDEVLFSAQYQRSFHLWKDQKGDIHSVPYFQLVVESVLDGKVGVRRFKSLRPLPGLVEGKTDVFRWRPSTWAKADLTAARQQCRSRIWLMPWEPLERLAEPKP